MCTVVSVAQSVSAFGCYLTEDTERLVVQAHPGTLIFLFLQIYSQQVSARDFIKHEDVLCISS